MGPIHTSSIGPSTCKFPAELEKGEEKNSKWGPQTQKRNGRYRLTTIPQWKN